MMGILNEDWYLRNLIAASNTISSSRFKLFVVRLFGKKEINFESGYKIVLYKFRGKYYLIRKYKVMLNVLGVKHD